VNIKEYINDPVVLDVVEDEIIVGKPTEPSASPITRVKRAFVTDSPAYEYIELGVISQRQTQANPEPVFNYGDSAGHGSFVYINDTGVKFSHIVRVFYRNRTVFNFADVLLDRNATLLIPRRRSLLVQMRTASLSYQTSTS